ncbi:MAG: hypothetical protein OXM56_13915 [Gammaproteobacteria bacterium]|nr:hypothetical protein [Gammaproteobacteria bacterium]
MAEAIDIREQDDAQEAVAGKGVKVRESERGPFAIWENPEMGQAYELDQALAEQVAEGFDISALAEKFGEAPAREKLVDMLQAIGPGVSTTMLFSQPGPTGMSLAHVWFGADFPLFRHSHPRFGDCLYYVIAGEIVVGRRRLGPGSGFFVPNGMPYKYTAGPAGVELLEFRAGGGDPEAPGMKFDEHSLDAVQNLIDRANDARPGWKRPERIGDTALVQAELDFG